MNVPASGNMPNAPKEHAVSCQGNHYKSTLVIKRENGQILVEPGSQNSWVIHFLQLVWYGYLCRAELLLLPCLSIVIGQTSRENQVTV